MPLGNARTYYTTPIAESINKQEPTEIGFQLLNWAELALLSVNFKTS